MTAAVHGTSGTCSADLEAAWQVCADLFCAVQTHPTLAQRDLEHELLFCLLGGHGVTFEHALSASASLMQLGPFTSRLEDDALLEQLRAELDKSQFEPPKQNGTLRRYRYPTRKADLIVRARSWLRSHPNLFDELFQLRSERDR